jgi:glucuronokinase
MKRIVRRAYARAGLLGNPSDGYHGKTISLIVGQFFAEVEFSEAPEITILPMPGEERRYPSLAAMQQAFSSSGYYGSERLILAALKKFADFFGTELSPNAPTFQVSARTNIPRQVGMAGSSAIVMATLRAALSWHGMELAPELLASLTLAVEQEELGIPAGLQDRVIQAFEGLVFMDFSQAAMTTQHGLTFGRYERMNPELLPPIYVAYAQGVGEPTEVFHNDLRSRYQSGDATVIAAMEQFAAYAEEGRQVLERGDHARLHELINANFDLRRSLCRLNPAHIAMVEAARAVGASAKFCGSGGAIIGTFRDDAMFHDLTHTLAQQNCQTLRPDKGMYQQTAISPEFS